ncbi:MAG: ATP-binding protein, partial [Chloroflexota bacterium]|nr:ATP-binding protein [Chloroflexota bacterium]
QHGMTTGLAEALGDSGANAFAEMAFSIEKSTVTARSRALKAEYTMELAQDLKAIHGLDAETELANILSAEILSEINREVIRTIYINAREGAQSNVTARGIFDLDTDSGGRWSVEKFKGLMFAMERDANVIARDTRRGKGNILICSADVASAMTMAGLLDYQSALQDNLNVDSTGNTFAGVLNGRLKVYVDPYANMGVAPAGAANLTQYYCVGYKGTSPYDAGLFYCPYVPLQMVRAVGENSFQPKIGFKTRYGLIVNPFAEGSAQQTGPGAVNANTYYRRAAVTNLT